MIFQQLEQPRPPCISFFFLGLHISPRFFPHLHCDEDFFLQKGSLLVLMDVSLPSIFRLLTEDSPFHPSRSTGDFFPVSLASLDFPSEGDSAEQSLDLLTACVMADLAVLQSTPVGSTNHIFPLFGTNAGCLALNRSGVEGVIPRAALSSSRSPFAPNRRGMCPTFLIPPTPPPPAHNIQIPLKPSPCP